MQVVGAKVVTNAKSPGARCYGFVTMSSAEEATKCISHLHRTELHGRMISVERVSNGRSLLLHHSAFKMYLQSYMFLLNDCKIPSNELWGSTIYRDM